MQKIRHDRNTSVERRSSNPTKRGLEDKDPRQKGLIILARMIARAYLEEVARKRIIQMGLKPRLYIETIKITMNCTDINNPKERQKLHSAINEALEKATLEGWRENSTPFVLKKDSLRIMLKG